MVWYRYHVETVIHPRPHATRRSPDAEISVVRIDAVSDGRPMNGRNEVSLREPRTVRWLRSDESFRDGPNDRETFSAGRQGRLPVRLPSRRDRLVSFLEHPDNTP
ncbi:hypothetical protein [Halalkalicoccus salilacus]|uniref:hypothetical protein n=1 Tax=Halalkalicoccus salilacus TaxID=3117459 RepID=UPI00300E777F